MELALTSFLLFLLAVITLVPSLYRMTIDFAEPGVWFALFYFAHFGFRGMSYLVFRDELAVQLPSVMFTEIQGPLFIAILGLISFWMGYFGVTRGYQSQLNIRPSLPAEWNYTRAVYVGLGCLLVGWIIRFGMMYLQAGGIIAWITAPKTELLYIPGLAYVKLFQRTIPTAGVLILVIVALKTTTKKYYFIILLAAMAELGFRIILGKRSRFFFFLLMLLIVYYMTSNARRKLSPRLTIVSFGVLTLLLAMFPIISHLRRQGAGELLTILVNIPEMVTDFKDILFTVTARLHGLDSLALVVHNVPSDVQWTSFSELLLIPVGVIPRAVWRGKPPINMGLRFNQEFIPAADPSRAIAVTMPGMFYWDAGVIGVLFGMVFVGILWRLLYEYFVRPEGNLTGAFVTSTIFPTFFMTVEQTLVSLFTWHFFKFCIVVIIALLVVTPLNNQVRYRHLSPISTRHEEDAR